MSSDTGTRLLNPTGTNPFTNSDLQLSHEIGSTSVAREIVPQAERVDRLAQEKLSAFESNFESARLTIRSRLSEGVRLFYEMSTNAYINEELEQVSRCIDEIRHFDPRFETLALQDRQIVLNQSYTAKMQKRLTNTLQELRTTQQELIKSQKLLETLKNERELEARAEKERRAQSERETRAQFEMLEPSERAILEKVIIGPEQWKACLGDPGVIPPLPRHIYQMLFGPCPFWGGKRIHETHRLVLIPKTLDGLPVTLNLLEKLMKNPKQGLATKCDQTSPTVFMEHGNKPSASSYWILMTTQLIPEALHGDLSVLTPILARDGGGFYRVPALLEATACILMEYIIRGTILYPNIFTLCQEKDRGDPGYQTCVGFFYKECINISINHGHSSAGLAGVRPIS